MAKPILYTAIYNGSECTLGIRPWGRKVDKSPDFLRDRLAEAEHKGIPMEDRMQYAIEQKKRWSNGGSRKRHPQLPEAVRKNNDKNIMIGRQEILNKMARVSS